MQVRVLKIKDNAKVPVFAHDNDAGADVFAIERTVVPARGRATIPTGIGLAVPDGYVALVFDKSGLASKYGLFKAGGVIDSGYRGEIHVIMTNTADNDYIFEEGDKLAQIVFQKVEHPDMVVVSEFEDTERGDSGFGSTGK